MTPEILQRENRDFQNTGGVSHHNRNQGFRSAFLDSATGRVYLSRFADGAPAPIHMLDGLPDEVVSLRNCEGRVVTVKHTVIAGFLFAEQFYTREQVAEILAVD